MEEEIYPLVEVKTFSFVLYCLIGTVQTSRKGKTKKLKYLKKIR